MVFVKRFLKNICNYFSVEFATSSYIVAFASMGYCLLSSPTAHCTMPSGEFLFCRAIPSVPLATSSWHIYYTTFLWFCQGVFQNFFKKFSREGNDINFYGTHRLCSRPLTVYIISYITQKVNSQIAQTFTNFHLFIVQNDERPGTHLRPGQCQQKLAFTLTIRSWDIQSNR